MNRLNAILLTVLAAVLFSAVEMEMSAQDKKDWRAVKYPRGRGRVAPDPKTVAKRAAFTEQRYGQRLSKLRKVTAATYDCVALGQDCAIQDQGQCGDCYAFSGTQTVADAQLTANIVSLAKNPGFELSVQWTLDCHPEFGGCGGGDEWEVAAQYLAPNTGGPSLADYPGAGQSPGKCAGVAGKTMYTISAMGYCDPAQAGQGVAATQLIKNTMVQYGPISVAVAAGSWGDPGTTVITGNDNQVDHAIMLVGWDDTKGTAGAWKMKNSWGTGWGNGGYAWIAYGADSVGTEAFWVAAQPLPPVPPTPPVPPGPVPPIPPVPPGPVAPVTITLSASLPAGTYSIAPAGYEYAPAGTNAIVNQLLNLYQQPQKKAEIDLLIDRLAKGRP